MPFVLRAARKNDVMMQWLDSPAGRYFLEWETRFLDEQVADIFGFYAVQLGISSLPGLRANRMPDRWYLAPTLNDKNPVQLLSHFEALPFESQSLDLLVLPHTLETSDDPHQVLREAERVLVPEGRLIVVSFNPWSLWGARQKFHQLTGHSFFPPGSQLIGLPRLKDWLKLLNFEIEAGRFGCYRFPCRSEAWLKRGEVLEKIGNRWWPVFGAVYALTAVKRVHGMRLIGPAWKNKPRKSAAVAAVTSRR